MERFFTARGLRLERGLPSAHAKLHAKISLTGEVDRTGIRVVLLGGRVGSRQDLTGKTPIHESEWVG